MRISQLADGPFGKLDGKLFSPIASVRLRATEIAPELVKLGDRVSVVPIGAAIDRIRDESLFESDVFVLQKVRHDVSPLLDEIRAAGKPVIVDVCDDIASASHFRDFYPDMLRRADIVTVSSEALVSRCQAFTGAEVIAIPDCVELQRGEARGPNADPLNLLWFGRSKNIAPLIDQIPELLTLAGGGNMTLTIVSDVSAGLADRIRTRAGPPIAVAIEDWSPATLQNALEKCDIAVLPLSRSAADLAKSANRLQEVLWAGRCAVASSTRANQAYADCAYIGDTLAAGIRTALSEPESTLKRIRNGQDRVAKEVTPAALAPRWHAAFESAARVCRPGAPAPRLTRLNLGCGDKPMPGYINVDIAANRKERAPDVLSDLRKLEAFESGTVDEVIAIHVLEHFHRWEVNALLKEWCRVLRPGGRLILECPNILTACEELLKDPSLAINSDRDGAEVMWPLYGDPSWKDPLMVHRWGYTPESLADVMQKAGLVNIRREQAQFKRREPRDMRVTGEKAVSA